MRFVVMIALVIAACQSSDRAPPPQTTTGKLELVDAPATPAGSDVAPMIAQEYARAEHDGKRLVVYVGATWCEPCQEFHAAAAAGKLDTVFSSLRLLVFDNDRDAEVLDAAGYRSQLIPLFVLPRPDGRASGKQIEGSIKGADAVKQISPRLEALLRAGA